MKKTLSKINLLFLIFLFAFSGCKKDADEEGLSQEGVVTITASNLDQRVAMIKAQFYSQQLDKRIAPNVGKTLEWVPDWKHPELQNFGDSLSYIFIPLLGQILTDSVQTSVNEENGRSYLMIKDGNEYFKASYRRSSLVDMDRKDLSDFTGALYLKNLKSNHNYIVNYIDGKPSKFQKRALSNIREKKMTVPNTVSNWEVNCILTWRECTYITKTFTSCGRRPKLPYSIS